MLLLQIKRRRNTNVDAKQALRIHIEQLPLDQQRAFVSLAFELMSGPITGLEAETTRGYRPPVRELQQ